MAKGAERATYRAAGVDLEAAQEVVKRIRRAVESTYCPRVLKNSHGSFGGFFSLYGDGSTTLDDPVLVSATDGVGTKLKVAFEGPVNTVGIDLVAMCVNDLVVSGARPLFFLDYLATGSLEAKRVAEIVEGVAEGCRRAGCALLGGETAEMPGFYGKGEFDLAGFAVGVVERRRLIDGRRVRPGDPVIGLPSSGLHSNGYSLVRRVLLQGRGRRALAQRIPELGRTLEEELLEPTRIYVQPILSLLEQYRREAPVRALAHITGGGLVENIPRVLPPGCGVMLRRRSWEVPAIFSILKKEGRIAQKEMDRVFNLGLGMILIAAPRRADRVIAHLNDSGVAARVVGEVVAGKSEVRFQQS